MSLKPIMDVSKWSNNRTKIKTTIIKNEAIIHSHLIRSIRSFDVTLLLMIFHFNICAYVYMSNSIEFDSDTKLISNNFKRVLIENNTIKMGRFTLEKC